MPTDHDDEGPPGEVAEFEGGFSWIAQPEERGRRASHALATDAGVWLVDPVDAPGLDERIAALGEVAGVVVLLDRHTRDAAELAARHDVSVSLPEWMALAREKLSVDPVPIADRLPGTDYRLCPLIESDEWEEAILAEEATGTLVVPETLGTLAAFEGAADSGELGVHPAIDDPPSRLAEYEPDRIVVGHGENVTRDATAKLRAVVPAE